MTKSGILEKTEHQKDQSTLIYFQTWLEKNHAQPVRKSALASYVAKEAAKAGNDLQMDETRSGLLTLLSLANHFTLEQKEQVTLIQDFMTDQSTNQEADHDLLALAKDIGHSPYAKKALFEVEPVLRQQLGSDRKTDLNDQEWLEHLDSKLRELEFGSEYGKTHYLPGLEKNLLNISKLRKKLDKKTDLLLQKELQVDETELKELKKKYAKVSGKPDRGIETLFRLTSKNHYTLNAMVDRKSHIMISINSIILSIILGTLLGKIYDDPHLLVPIVMILITNLSSIVFAIFATRPQMSHDDKKSQGASAHHLLFYGNFRDLSEEEYVSGMSTLMDSSEKLYSSISRDIYYLGKGLQQKFGYLRSSFNIFMYGLIASVITFVACHVFFGDFFV